jgi:hypothetical protein
VTLNNEKVLGDNEDNHIPLMCFAQISIIKTEDTFALKYVDFMQARRGSENRLCGGMRRTISTSMEGNLFGRSRPVALLRHTIIHSSTVHAVKAVRDICEQTGGQPYPREEFSRLASMNS